MYTAAYLDEEEEEEEGHVTLNYFVPIQRDLLANIETFAKQFRPRVFFADLGEN